MVLDKGAAYNRRLTVGASPCKIEGMKPHLFNLCPESELYIPKHGKSAFVRACIIDVGRRMNKSKGMPAPASVEPVAFVPASVEPVAVEPVAVAPVAVAPAPAPPAPVAPVTWQRSWRKPSCEMPADVDYSKFIHKIEGGRSICLNPPPWPAFPGLTRNHYLDWSEYVAKWRFPDPFPGPLEWHSMGEPSEPLPEHRVLAEDVEPVEPLPVVEESPLPTAVLSVEPSPVEPSPVVGMSSSSILEEV